MVSVLFYSWIYLIQFKDLTPPKHSAWAMWTEWTGFVQGRMRLSGMRKIKYRLPKKKTMLYPFPQARAKHTFGFGSSILPHSMSCLCSQVGISILSEYVWASFSDSARNQKSSASALLTNSEERRQETNVRVVVP